MVLKPDTRQECLYGCSDSFTNSLNRFYYKGIILSLAPVAGNAVQEDETCIHLDLLEFILDGKLLNSLLAVNIISYNLGFISTMTA